jgi:ribokinase
MNRVRVLESHMQPTSGAPQAQGGNGVVVLGACFIDYIGYVDHHPKPGQTVESTTFAKGFGGKGANQAVMAGKLGAPVRMVSLVGADADGKEYLANFTRTGTDTTFVKEVANANTGLAMITVDKNAENCITICPNATATMTPVNVRPLLEKALVGQKFLVTQNEIPLETTIEALKLAHAQGLVTIFNSAPAPTPAQWKLLAPLLPQISILCPNETEASLMCGFEVTNVESAVEAVSALREQGATGVVITLGKKGCVVAEPGDGNPYHIPSVPVKAIDTTGAGDCFVGTMAYYLSQGKPLRVACERANAIAAISVQAKGTQSSYPGRNALPPQLLQ